MKVHQRAEKKSGSALLVVLGFLSFMVVSAVAFAIYMRSERVPSSALRRNTTTRHLVKAALAHAMSRVDDAVRGDPFPGLANTNGSVNCYRDVNDNAMDVWFGRVFMPPNPSGLVDDNGNPVRGANNPGDVNTFAWRFAPVTETVSVLNLEALGYLPPPLVNDVRFLSRSTWTAKWQNFAYDAGRFAFCAVNVSDYFDINRTTVGARSSPLHSCISLRGPLSVERRSDGTYDMKDISGSISALEKLIGPLATRPTYSNTDRSRGAAAKATTEYVSLLDYNLAFGAQPGGVGSVLKPYFYSWIHDSGSKENFYGGTTGDPIDRALRQPFVTDSFWAATNLPANMVDLATLAGQPYQSGVNQDRSSLQDAVQRSGTRFLQNAISYGVLGNADPLTLFDYLDHDDVPLSLAMPSAECVPMVTAVELIGNYLAALKVDAGTQVKDPESTAAPFTGTQTITTPYKLDSSSFDSRKVGVRLLVSFPFRHFAGRDISGFKAQVAMKVFVSSAENIPLRPTGGFDLRPKDKSEWNRQSKAFTTDGQGPGNALAWTLFSNKENISIQAGDTQSDAILKIDVRNWNGSADVPGDQSFFTKITRQQFENGVSRGTPVSSYQFNLVPFQSNGQLVDGNEMDEAAFNALANQEFRTYAMLWVRITDSAGDETYDLAPAVVADDTLNGLNNDGPAYEKFFGSTASSACLLFRKDPAKSYTYAGLANPTPDVSAINAYGSVSDWSPKAVATVDPRYNYAPEDWFVWDQSGITPEAWLKKVGDAGFFNVGDERDPDIFMFTSNQGYLQSLGEIAFLPRLSERRRGGNAPALLQKTPGNGNYASVPGEILNNRCAWRTHIVDREFYDACAEAGIGKSTSHLQTVNPYTDSPTILSAAIADTPCDYWTTGRIVAGTEDKLDDEFQKIVDTLGDDNFKIKTKDCPKYVFGKDNRESSSRMEPKDVFAIANNLASFVRGAAPALSWETAYDELFDQQIAILDGGGDYKRTDDNAENFMGVTDLQDCPLYSIDRKFLYSYWRDCFSNKQQLFLIFVRAEATALGGPGEGTPSQQGGRAVALVWRDPNASTGNGRDGANDDRQTSYLTTRRPHRMRVLFYHQFD